jgi:hypothetical protein
MLDTATATDVIHGRAPAIAACFVAISPCAVCVTVMPEAELPCGAKRPPADYSLHVGIPQSDELTATVCVVMSFDRLCPRGRIAQRYNGLLASIRSVA